jgi:integrase
VLRITAGIDKNEYARTLPLTDVARAALDSVCPSEGLIFGKHDYRPQLQKAAKQVLPPHLAVTFTAYDLRHRCATELAATGDLTGAAYLMGHKQVTTLNRYARPEQSAAARVLAARSRAIGAVAWGSRQKGRHSAAVGASDSVMNPML